MTSRVLQQFNTGFATVILGFAGFAPAALAQEARGTIPGLSENQEKIGVCRQVNTDQLIVYRDVSLTPSNQIGTLDRGDQVMLTGVLFEGRAQVYNEDLSDSLTTTQPVGWVDAGGLGECTSQTSACFSANLVLNVRSAPTTSVNNVFAYFSENDTIYTTANPPIRQQPGDGRTWMEVRTSGPNGWVAETNEFGVGGNVTSITCP